MIDYNIINESIKFYSNFGFKRIESPWTVTEEISNITKPKGKKDFFIKNKNKVLVASGEQSFLYLFNKGFLPDGRYQSVTPCFRDEPFSIYHTKYFIKNELIVTGDEVNEKLLYMIVETCKEFFSAWLQNKDVKIEPISDLSYDITCDTIELGSYGIRKCEFLKWIYATGVAEPRFSRLIEKVKNNGISYKSNSKGNY